MNQFRYSMNALLLAIVIIVLLFSTLSAVGVEKSTGVVAQGGLSFCTAIFLLLCALLGETAPRIMRLGAGLYVWGLVSLLLGNSFELNGYIRLVLAAVGVAYVSWAWVTAARRA